MKEKITTIAFLILIGCNQNNSNKKENIEFPDSTNTSKEVVIKNDNEKINYNIIEEFIGQDGLYKFKALIRTDRFDEQGIFSKKDLISKYKRKIKTSYFFDKNDWFVLSGNDSESNIIYLKGFYEELESMQGRDEGEPSWLWSKSGVLEIQYTEKNKEEFDKLIPLIIKSFKCDFSLI